MKQLISLLRVRLPFTVPLVLRYVLITLLLTGFVLGAWSGITPTAHAATHAATTPKHAHQTTGVQQQPAVASQPGTPRHPTLRPDTSSSVNQLGILPFYTYISQRLTGHIGLSINVANGNLVVQSNDLHISGTGLNLDVASYYNSLAGTSTLCYLNTPWSVDLPNVFLRPESGSVILCGQSGYSATYVQSGSSYSDAPGIDATLVKQGDGTYTLTFHASSVVYTFNAGGSLTQVTDKNGNHLSFSYGSHGLSASTDTQGRVTTFTGSSGVISSLTDPLGRTVQYTPAAGKFTLTDLVGKITTFTYVPGLGSTRIATITDSLGQNTSLTYDSLSRVATLTDATNAKTSFVYDTTNKKTTVTDANGHATVYYWDSQGRVTKIVDALGHSTTISFTSDNKPSQTTDPLNTQTSFGYDAKGQRTSTSYPNGVVMNMVYDKAGHLTNIWATKGSSTLVAFDYQYGSADLYFSSGGPAGTTDYTYDSLNRLREASVGQVTDYKYWASSGKSEGCLLCSMRFCSSRSSCPKLFLGVGNCSGTVPPNSSIVCLTLRPA